VHNVIPKTNLKGLSVILFSFTPFDLAWISIGKKYQSKITFRNALYKVLNIIKFKISLTLYDYIIRNGLIVDGCGNPWFRADLGIKNGRIAAIKRSITSKSEKTIDAKKLIVAPGFIDIHSHSDLCLIFDGCAQSKIRQGVTTEVVGNCGMSAAPISKDQKIEIKRHSSFLLPPGVEVDLAWNSVAEYLETLEKRGISVNVVTLAGHGNLRIWSLGYSDAKPTKRQIREMKALLEQSIKEGAFGFSTGLMYSPSGYASTDELIELAKVASKSCGIHASHIRNEGERVFDAIKEIIEISKASGVSAEISHIKSQPPEFWGHIPGILGLIEGARRSGVDVTCDAYPYTAGSTYLSAVVLPLWVVEGGIGMLVKKLRDSNLRAKIKKESLRRHYYRREDCNRIFICASTRFKEYEGLSIGEVARSKGEDPVDFMLDLLEEDPSIQVILDFMDENEVKYALGHPLTMIGSDGYALNTKGPLGEGKPHPRSYGTFPRVLAKYVREEATIRLEEAIRKMTSYPAQRLGLRARGKIAIGFWADLTLFSMEGIKDEATYLNPHRYPSGIEYVLVNGELVIEEGEHTGAKPGRVLRHSI
jgi:N-acyl-D-amino-acid deacylase